jgi:hypothetical protein
MPAVEETVSSKPERCLRITGDTARVTFIECRLWVDCVEKSCSKYRS